MPTTSIQTWQRLANNWHGCTKILGIFDRKSYDNVLFSVSCCLVDETPGRFERVRQSLSRRYQTRIHVVGGTLERLV